MKKADYFAWQKENQEELEKREKILKAARYSTDRQDIPKGNYVDPQSEEAERICKGLMKIGEEAKNLCGKILSL